MLDLVGWELIFVDWDQKGISGNLVKLIGSKYVKINPNMQFLFLL